MEKQRKKRIKRYISWALIAALVIFLALLPAIAGNEDSSDGPQASVLSDTVQVRDISSQIMGGGTLTAENAVEITIPAAVKLTEYLVRNGDTVTEGQEIAAADRVTVMTAITQVQETMEYLQKQIDDVRGDTASGEVAATAGGTVKAIYGRVGEQVQDVILNHGALAVLSLDGLMAVQINRSTGLAGGDQVCVTLSDGTEVDGRVESNLEGVLTVTVDDNGYAIGEEVKVSTDDGDRIGTGTLYIHSQWNVVAYSGTISNIRVSEGDAVKAGKTLFVLKDTGHTAEFESLLRQYREYEALMLELFKMYQSERVLAPGSGMITGVDENGAYMLSDKGSGWTLSLLANAPNGDDETAYLHYIGQVAEVGIDGLILKINPQALEITNYMDLSEVPLDPELMTEDAIYSADAPVYELLDEEWVQIEMSDIAAGDVLLFAGDSTGSFVWVIRVEQEGEEPEIPEATEPEEPTEPENASEQEVSADREPPADTPVQTFPNQSRNSGTQGSYFSGMGGGMTQEETMELYGLDTVTIASVTPQDTLTIQIIVDELDISKVYAGQPAVVTINALIGEQFDGVITRISASGENDGGNSKFTVEVTVNKAADMLAGMSASVAIPTETVSAVLSVPVAALIEADTKTLLYTAYDEETGKYGDPVEVSIGASDGAYAEVISGISEGQMIYYPYYDTLIISNVPDSGGFGFGR